MTVKLRKGCSTIGMVLAHDTPRAQTCTFRGPGPQKHQQNSTKRPQEREGRKKIVVGGGKTKSEILGCPVEGCPAEGGPAEGGPVEGVQRTHITHTPTPHQHHTVLPQHTKSMTTWIEATGLQHTRVHNKKCMFDFGQFRLQPILTSANFDFGQFRLWPIRFRAVGKWNPVRSRSGLRGKMVEGRKRKSRKRGEKEAKREAEEESFKQRAAEHLAASVPQVLDNVVELILVFPRSKFRCCTAACR